MPASTLLRAESRNLAPLWPLLCSAVLVGIMLASETVRENRARGSVARRRSTHEPILAQYERAHQPGRGRHAETPWQIPWKGWKDIFWRTYEQIGEDRLLAVAAGVVFYGLLAVFPAVTAFVSLYGLFASASAATATPKTVDEALAELESKVGTKGRRKFEKFLREVDADEEDEDVIDVESK
jgi:hypothetical protein